MTEAEELTQAMVSECINQLRERLDREFPIFTNLDDIDAEADDLVYYRLYLDELCYTFTFEGDVDTFHLIYELDWHDEYGNSSERERKDHECVLADPNWIEKAIAFLDPIIQDLAFKVDEKVYNTMNHLDGLREMAKLLHKEKV